MPKTKSTKNTKVKIEREDPTEKSVFSNLQVDLQNKQSFLNLILGALIVIVLGILLFNYFNRPQTDNIGPAQQSNQQPQSQDVNKKNLPGKYIVKEGDTLFTIAQKYYGDGYLYPKIVEENKLANENIIEKGQELQIPKIENPQTQTMTTPTSSQSAETNNNDQSQQTQPATGGAENQTIWGEKISGDTYTVQTGDWLSKIAGRAYGDVMQFEKIAKANNLSNPDVIEVGTVLKIPR